MEYSSVKDKLNNDNVIGSGKEIVAYKIDNDVVKIFNKVRLSVLDFIG